MFGIPDTLPSWMTAGQQESTTTSTTSPATTTTDTASMLSSPTATADATTAAGPVEVKPTSDWGPESFAYQIAKQAKDLGLSAAKAKIGMSVPLVEVGDPMKMYANNAVPDSLNYRHDSVGSDSDSIGLYQQRQAGWGTVADRMDPYRSAGMFFNAMLKKYPDWSSMDPGAVAQGVQVSAYPDRYATKMGRAEELVSQTGRYDQGGVLDHKRLALNLSGKPEAILTNDQWSGLSNIATIAAQASAGALGAAANSVVPGSGALVFGAMSALTPLIGTVADSIPDTIDEMFSVDGPVGVSDPTVGGPTGVDTTSTSSSDDDGPNSNGGNGTTVIYQVNVATKEDAYETVKKLQAREYAGFGVTR